MKPVQLELTNGAYETSAAHLRDELTRVDLLVRAQVVRWQLTTGAVKPEQLWGMLVITKEEIAQYLATDPAPPTRMPDSLKNELEPYWQLERQARADLLLAVNASHLELRVERLRTAFALEAEELDVVLLALLPEVDGRYRRIYGYLQDDANRSAPSTDLLGEILHDKVPTLEKKRALFEPSGRLLRWQLVHVSDRAVRIDPRIASFLAGHDPDADLLPTSNEKLRPDLDAFANDATAPKLVVLHGPRGSGRAHAAGAIAAARGLSLLRFDADDVNASLLLAWREALLRNAALLITGEALPVIPDPPPVLTFVAREASDGAFESRALRFDFGLPRYDERRAIWVQALPQSPEREALATQLASSFQLSAEQIRDAMASAEMLARRRSMSDPRITADDLSEACRRQAGRRLLGFARRIQPTPGLTIDDVILGRANRTQLHELRDRVKLRPRLAELTAGKAIDRGEGLVVLFAGPSGTGKTLAATALASEHGVDLYKVDASAIVSKYVGETEKNLSRVFADAEGSDALLFFDECDSLFGHRGEINDGNDRWANLQVNYLLQRVEDYPGVIILATNLRNNIDDAFLRRIHGIVEFPLPDPELRLELWRRSVVQWQGLADDDLRRLADRFSLTGGSIGNAATESMFRALAKERETLALREVIASIAREYQKLGRPVTKGEFGEEFYAWAVADVIAPAG